MNKFVGQKSRAFEIGEVTDPFQYAQSSVRNGGCHEPSRTQVGAIQAARDDESTCLDLA